MLSLLEPDTTNRRAWDSIRSFILYVEHWDAPGLSTSELLQLPPVTNFTLCPPADIPAYFTLETPIIMQERLTSFEFICTGAGYGVHLLSALQSCINLEKLTIDMEFVSRFIKDRRHPIIQSLSPKGFLLPRLQHLKMAHLTRPAMAEFLEFLVAPTLASLDLGFEDLRQAEDTGVRNRDQLPSFNFFFRRPQNLNTKHTLRSFTLRGIATMDWQLKNALSAWPELVHLKLENVFFQADGGPGSGLATPNIGQNLTPSDGGAPLLNLDYLRNLEILELHGLDSDFPIQTALWAVRETVNLKKVDITYRAPSPKWGSELHEIASGLRSDNPGIEVRIEPYL
ncbi:hypothetical protein H1R20_g293, partial [Candolleomyces eurysporus]